MTLLLLAGIAVLVAVQLAMVLHCAKQGTDETTKARIIDGILLGLILILVFRLESLGMRGGILIAYLVIRCIAEGFRRKIKKTKKDEKSA